MEREDKPSPTDNNTISRLIIKVDQIQGRSEIQPCTGRFLLETKSQQADRVSVGQPLVVKGWLEELPDSLNPGEWSLRKFWQSRGVEAYMDARNRGQISPDPNGHSIWWRVLRETIRKQCRIAIQTAVPESRSGLIEALVLGIRENVSTPAKELFRDTGTLHLLAISGLHLQVVSMFVMWLSSRVGIGLNTAAWIVVVTSGVYAFIVTGGASVTRATIMAMAISAAVIRHRSGSFIHRMALSGAIVLWIKPGDLFDAGAQLSFLGTASIFLASLSWQKLAIYLSLETERNPLEIIWLGPSSPFFFEDQHQTQSNSSWKLILFKYLWTSAILCKSALQQLLQALYISSFVWLMTAVLVAYHFGSINPVAILVNIPLVPATSLALVSGLAGILLSFTGLSVLANPLIVFCGWLMHLCLIVLDFAMKHGTGPSIMPQSGPMVVSLFYGLMVAVYFVNRKIVNPTSRRLLWALPLLWLSVSTAITNHLHYQPPESLEVEMLAVDHGLSLLIRWPDGQNWLYDCGQMGRPNVGRMVVAPALRARGVHQIDALLISHADSDHFNGVESLMESGMRIQQVISTANFFQSRQPDALILKNLFVDQNITTKTVHAGDILHDDRNGVAWVRFPNPDTRPGRADNATSLVLELSAFDMKMIITGDLEGEGLHEFASNKGESAPKLECDVMTAPHHGGLTSNPAWLYEQLSPRFVLSSQGKNRFGMVAGLQKHIARYRPECKLLTTASDGAIRLQWSPDGLRVKGFAKDSPEIQLPRRNPPLEQSDTGPAQVILNP